jgi:asparagine synthase (glutamine-hydrolysing)
VLVQAGDARAEAWTNRMLARLAGGRNWRSASSGPLGWTGWREPQLAENQGIVVALDGRIFNRRELGPETDDAALVARLVREHGLGRALARMNGDFALAVFDRRDGTMLLARDRFGVKPLYYAAADGAVAFASQPGALLALPGVDASPDPSFVVRFAGSHYRTFDNDPGRSPYLGVAQVPAATIVSLRSGALADSARYWSLSCEPDERMGESELAERYRELLLDAVAIRRRELERPAFTLSGGMDSSSVLACASRCDDRGEDAFSTVYDDATYDESADIAPMLGGTVSAWHPVRIGSPDVLALVSDMVGLHDEPVATATWLSHHVLAGEVAASGFSGLLGGLGGDELNAGEYEYFVFHFADLRAQGREDELEHEIERWAEHHDDPVFRKGRAVAEKGMARLTDAARPGRCLPDRARMLRYASALMPECRAELERFEPELASPSRSYLKNRAYQDLTVETIPCCLRAEDRQTTARGLEHFVPFLDHRLVELLFRVPGELKIRDGVTKRLLREAVKGIVPEETRTRVKKTGWNAPAHVWFSGAGGEQLLDLVRSQRFRERGIYDVAEVERLIGANDEIVSSGRPAENHMMFLWQLVNLETWLGQLDGT